MKTRKRLDGFPGTGGCSRMAFVPLLAALLWVGVNGPLPWLGNFERAHAQDCPADDAQDSLKAMLDDPGDYVGCAITVEGSLEKSEGEGGKSVYYLRGPAGVSPEIWPWAPDESYRAGSYRKDQPGLRQMSDYVGLQLRIVGRIVQETSGKVVLEASTVEER